MSPSKKGRFCASCQKNVNDFTKSSDREIFLAYKEDENLCGRFKTSQLEREINIPKEKNSIWVIATASLIAFLGLGNHTAIAQGKPTIVQTDQKTTEKNLPVDCDNEEIEINGQIIIDDNNPNFEDVEILVVSKNKIVHPSTDGKFCFTANKKDSLLFTKTGFEPYNTFAYKLSKFASIELFQESKCETYTLGGAYVITKRSFLYRLFHKN
ncbi:hypothetical protein [Flavobacterium hungaricum]|uniref:CarboxypepD_reg-like domain-containing protein n=1 Tax=Flavobacterium hungaricum TaxID=2082725 RepID=A0ABR9TFK0_9FLAO|nr:hypothetical protein [Flavobacterium hungaricum]MBE8724071.1 hypothetical protein [Flavobacterium hungaricum]